VRHKADIINTAEYLNIKYAEDQFVNIVKSSQPKMNSIIKMVAKAAEELNQSNENSVTKREDIQHINKR